jgi:hypothetical protein
MTHSSTGLQLGIFLLALVVFATFWCLLTVLISRLTGWAVLARRFRSQSEPYGDARTVGPWLLTIYMRYWTHYSSIVKITAANDALYLSINMIGFRAGHPPLSIPWSEIAFSSQTWIFFRRYVVMILGKQEKIPLRISERTARKLGILERVPK